MNAIPFPINSIVRLKSGGPDMLMFVFVPNRKPSWWDWFPRPYLCGCLCRWFDKNDELHSGWFQPDELELVSR